VSPSSKAKTFAKRAEEATELDEKLDNILKAIFELVEAVRDLER
jgi:hypothetical protein